MSQIYILESWEEISPLGSWTLSAARERSVDGPSPLPASDRAMWPHSLSHNWRTPGKPASISLDLPRNSRASIPSHSPCRRSGGGSAPPQVSIRLASNFMALRLAPLGLLRTWGLCWKVLSRRERATGKKP